VAVPLGVAAGDTAPQGAVEQLTVHVTPLLPASLVTVAVNCAGLPPCTVAVPGATAMTIPGGVELPPQPEIKARSHSDKKR
jgi:hypothetical protein